MDFLTILGLSLGLAMDAFAVAIVVGARLPTVWFRPFFRLSFHFGLFQFLMPILGWWAGKSIAVYIQDYDHWAAFGLLGFIGIRMIYESACHKPEENHLQDPTRKWSLVALSVATSIDALAVGLSVAMLNVSILFPSMIIGIVAAAMTGLGMGFGKKLGDKFGHCMEFLGGIILIAIGLKILLEHLCS